MKMYAITILLLGLSTFARGESEAPFGGGTDPSIFDPNYEYQFSKLPMKATLPPSLTPWSETYWPRYKGSINIRWNAPDTPGFRYYLYSKDEVKRMTRAQLAQLSPSEKFDLARGLYNYPLHHEVANGAALASARYWEGICDGWTTMAIQKKEPQPIDFINPDGVLIPFGSSDIKALMSYYAIFHFPYEPVYVGMNAGTYHVILANEIGLKKRAFGTDIAQNREVWNQPVYGFDFEMIASELASSPELRAYRIHSKLLYTDELDASSWAPVVGSPLWQGSFMQNDYVLEIDRDGNITGGRWVGGKHPRSFWRPTKEVKFVGDYDLLNKLYHSAPEADSLASD